LLSGSPLRQKAAHYLVRRFAVVDAVDFRRGFVRQRAVTAILIVAAIEIIDLDIFQQGNGLTANLIGGAIVDVELAGSAPDVDAAFA